MRQRQLRDRAPPLACSLLLACCSITAALRAAKSALSEARAVSYSTSSAVNFSSSSALGSDAGGGGGGGGGTPALGAGAAGAAGGIVIWKPPPPALAPRVVTLATVPGESASAEDRSVPDCRSDAMESDRHEAAEEVADEPA